MGFLEKLSWFLANSSSSLAFMISIFYWSFLFRDLSNLTFSNIFLHLLNSVSVLLDLCIVARPANLMHFLHPLLVGFWYLAFSVIYWAAGGTNVVS